MKPLPETTQYGIVFT